jgi:hypothetical protein
MTRVNETKGIKKYLFDLGFTTKTNALTQQKVTHKLW